MERKIQIDLELEISGEQTVDNRYILANLKKILELYMPTAKVTKFEEHIEHTKAEPQMDDEERAVMRYYWMGENE